jgi:hypothetical protein
MGIFIARVSGELVALVLALVSFFLQVVLRKKPDLSGTGRTVFQIVAGLGAAGGLFIVCNTILGLVTYGSRLSSIITVTSPLLLFAVAVTAHFVTLAVKRRAKLNIVPAIAATLQLAFFLFNTIRNWDNWTHGMREFFYIQILLVVLSAVVALLFWLSYRKEN